MFGSKKRHILTEGVQANAVVTKVDYAKVLGGLTTIQRDDNYKLELTLMVRPADATAFEATTSGYFTQFAQPSIGDQFWVRYDPDNPAQVEIDTARIAQDNAAVEARAAEVAASALPQDLAANGIPGRASLADVQKTPAGNLIDCTVTVNVRLVDGTPPYKATCHALLGADKAARLIPGSVFLTVRADPNQHSRVALSLSEATPVVTVTDPGVIDPPTRALREGQPCRVQVLLHQRQWLKTPAGDEFYATKFRVVSDGSELQVFQPVPSTAVELMQNGNELPAMRLPAEPNVLTVDWTAAQAERTGGQLVR